MIHSFLLIGQSNMAGRGFADEVDPIDGEGIKVLRNGRWQPIYVPVNPDRPFSGINLAESFALAYRNKFNVEVGLIPCADGGTSLDQWRPGGLLYDNAVYQTRLAMRTSNIAGVLWHQGEADCDEEKYPFYQSKFTNIMDSLRKALDLQETPFLLGELGSFLKDRETDPKLRNYFHVNDALHKIEAENKMVKVVSAEGLRANPDNLHFSAKALREFGIRYFEAFMSIADLDKVYEEKSDEYEIMSEMERL
ncbi:MAG: sialate O-acetylesterase [Monoglobaceae bacterium]